MVVYTHQVLDPEDFILPIYTIDNYRNIYLEDFVFEIIQILKF